MKFANIGTITSVAVALLVLQGCSTYLSAEKAKVAFQDADSSAAKQMDATVHGVKAKPVDSDSEVGRPWLAGSSVPLARELTLPPALRKGVKTAIIFKGSDSVDLMHAAAQLTAALKIPVRVKPDALMPQSDFLPRTPGSTAAAPAPGKDAQTVTMRLPDEMDGGEILNFISAQTGVSWEYKPEQNVIEIFRLITRTIEVKIATGSTSVELGLGRSGGQGGTFVASAETKLSVPSYDPVKDMKAGIDALLTRAGGGHIGGGLVVVTDTKEAVDRVMEFVARENRMASRGVRLVFEAIEVTTNDSQEAGIDWNLVYKKIAQGAVGDLTSVLGGKSGPSSVSQTAGALSFDILGNTRFNGSDVLLKALKEVGTVSSHTKIPMSTQNKRPVQYALRRTFDYVQSVELSSAASVGGVISTPAIKQKEESIGTVLTITPAAFDDGQIMLSLSYDATNLVSLKPYSVGTSDKNPTSTVQQRTIDGNGSLQVVQVRAGQTVMISGFERVSNSLDRRRMDESAPMIFGGSDKTARSKSTTLLLVTAVAVD